MKKLSAGLLAGFSALALASSALAGEIVMAQAVAEAVLAHGW
jgi:hypothetical protein